MSTTTASTINSMSPQLLVTDIERSLRFYTDDLGFDLDFRYGDFYVGIKRDGHSIHLKRADHSPQERAYRRDNDHLDITFSVQGVNAIYEGLRSRSVDITQPLRDMPYGREFYVSDPDGYILAFLETP